MRIFSTKKDSEQGQPAAAPVEPVEKPVIANQSAFLVWQSPNFSGPKLIGSTLKLGDSHASVRYFLGMTLRQHRTMGAAGFSGSFAPIVQYEKWEIHKVFPHFPYFRSGQNLSPNLLAPLCGVALKNHPANRPGEIIAYASGVSKPWGFFFCQFQESRHISARVSAACQPRISRLLVGSA